MAARSDEGFPNRNVSNIPKVEAKKQSLIYLERRQKDNYRKLCLESFPIIYFDAPFVPLRDIKAACLSKTQSDKEEEELFKILKLESFHITSPLRADEHYKLFDLSEKLQSICSKAANGPDKGAHPINSVSGSLDWEENGIKHTEKFLFSEHPWVPLHDDLFDKLISHLVSLDDRSLINSKLTEKRDLNLLGQQEQSFPCCAVVCHKYGPVRTQKGKLSIVVPIKMARSMVGLGKNEIGTTWIPSRIGRGYILDQNTWFWTRNLSVYLLVSIPIQPPLDDACITIPP